MKTAALKRLTLDQALVSLGVLTENRITAIAAEEHGVTHVFPYGNLVAPLNSSGDSPPEPVIEWIARWRSY